MLLASLLCFASFFLFGFADAFGEFFMCGVLLGFCFATAVPGAICYGGTYYVLKNRLNLE